MTLCSCLGDSRGWMCIFLNGGDCYQLQTVEKTTKSKKIGPGVNVCRGGPPGDKRSETILVVETIDFLDDQDDSTALGGTRLSRMQLRMYWWLDFAKEKLHQSQYHRFYRCAMFGLSSSVNLRVCLEFLSFNGENVANGTNSSRLRHCREDPRADKVDCNESPNFFSSPVQLVMVRETSKVIARLFGQKQC